MISVQIDDILSTRIEAVVRSVSSGLDPVTPLDRDLGLAAGSGVLEQLAGMGAFPVGGAVITPGGAGGALFLIHVVISSPEEPVSEIGVRKALLNGLRRAAHFGVGALALPALGVGAGNLDAEGSASATCQALTEQKEEGGLPESVRIVVANEYERAAFDGRLRVSGLIA